MKNKVKYFALVIVTILFLVGCKTEINDGRRRVYVSPDGDITSDGTSKKSPTDFVSAVSNALPGDLILLQGGRYSFNQRIQITLDGFPNQYITVEPMSNKDRVVLDFSEMLFNSANRGIQLYGDYWHFNNIEITGAGDNGMYISGSYNIIEGCLFYNNRDTGLQIGRGYAHENTIDLWPSYNLIKNCTSFANYDAETYGENADGFAAKLTVGYGNVFDGCIAFRNSDDGWDLFAKEDSGNIGTVVLYNCFSFENGFLPYPIKREAPDGSIYESYNTRDGDGIGFKLGGSTMEGDVLLNNCLAFNNKLHGFGDNSNPGFINISYSSAINNCIGLEENGDVSAVRGMVDTQNKSNNIDLARDTKSYNSYYGVLSFISNQKGYDVSAGDSSYNEDRFRGSTAYSIFQTGYSNGEVYKAFTSYEDASAYCSESTDVALSNGVDFKDISAASFASLDPINAKCSDVEHVSDLTSMHTALRNEDLSVNLKDTCKLTDSKLLTYANGKSVGATLTHGTDEEYTHYELLDFKNCKRIDEVNVEAAYNALEILAAQDAVYQDFEIAKIIQGCDIRWESSNSAVLEVQHEEKTSVSGAVFSKIKVNSPSTETKVTLTATITSGDVEKKKEFEVIVKGRNLTLGQLVSTGDHLIRLDLYTQFIAPKIYPLDASSITHTEFPISLYNMEYSYRYATDGNSSFHKVDNVYTSVSGVYEVTACAVLKSDPSIRSSYTYNVYVVDPGWNIDFKNSISLVSLNKDGFTISGKLSNIYGDLNAIVSDTPLEDLTYESFLAHPNLQKVEINSDTIVANFAADITTNKIQYIYYMVTNKNQSNTSAMIYSSQTELITVDTLDEFKNLASTGKKGEETPSTTTIYTLSKDLDFKDYEWAIPSKTEAKSFSGLFNGNGHTIKNITITGASADKTVNVFFKVANGTIMNVNFDSITIHNTDTAAGKQVGIIGDLQGGYLHNIKMTNISAKGREGVAALVGQVTGGENYITQCSLVNPIPEKFEDNKYVISAVNKYAGGIVGNGQKNNDQSTFKLTVMDCYVKAIIGDGNDAGGNTGGIVGRVKNESSVYYTHIERCYYEGTIIAKGNYNAGIIGDFDNGQGHVVIKHNFSDATFYFAGSYLDAKEAQKAGATQLYAHKNTNPICGRAVYTVGGIYETEVNYGTWKEYYTQYINSTSIVFDLAILNEDTYEYEWEITKTFIETSLQFDLENIWEFNEATKEINLR